MPRCFSSSMNASRSRPSSWAALPAVILRSAKRARIASFRRCSARSLTARFGATANPLADARGSDRSPDREGGVAPNSTTSRGRGTSSTWSAASSATLTWTSSFMASSLYRCVQPYRSAPGDQVPSRRERSRHHLAEGVLEFFHLFGQADGDAHVGGPDRPGAPDVDLFLSQCADNFPDRALHVDHEAVRLAGHIAEVVLFQKAIGCLAHVGDIFAPLRNHVLRLQAGAGGSHARDRHHAGAEPAELPQKVRTRDGGAGMMPITG